MKFKDLIISEYDDFIIAMKDIDEGATGYVYDVEEHCIYSAKCTACVDVHDEYEDCETAEEIIANACPGASFNYTGEIITDDMDYAVALEITDDVLVQPISEEEVWEWNLPEI